ncbi:MAG TPA: sigma-70 family RNA polymerase sigma factor [Solirubrobacterales bacterium]|nr:sigma-70 family RNA polymerase sigma factor [Solirubrobacterales bacterium]
MANEPKGHMANELKRLPTAAKGWRPRGSAGGPEASDTELLSRAGRDPDAFRDLYERYSGEILGYFRRRADQDTALELTAETFSRAWVMRERFEDRHDGSAAPWLYGIARNVLLMSIRRGEVERRTAARLGVLERLDLGDGSHVTPEASWADGADELLNSLPLSQREALRLRVVDELSYDEVASAVGTTRSAARVRVHRALTTLRERLSPSGGPTTTSVKEDRR